MTGLSSSAEHHKKHARAQESVSLALVTVSDSRTEETDENAHFLKEEIAQAGHKLISYQIIQDDPRQIIAILEQCVSSQAQVILFNGGTGISSRDVTFDVLSEKMTKVLPGFGELFRVLSFQAIGSAALLSRAAAGLYQNKIVISVPGSPQAVRLAWEKLIEPELSHLAWEITK